MLPALDTQCIDLFPFAHRSLLVAPKSSRFLLRVTLRSAISSFRCVVVVVVVVVVVNLVLLAQCLPLYLSVYPGYASL